MPYRDKIIYANNGSGASGSAVPSTSPALPTVVSNGHFALYNGSGTDAVAANNRIRFGTKFTFNGLGYSNMFAIPNRLVGKIVAEPVTISADSLTELYTDIVNYSSSSASLTADEKLYDMIVIPKRKPVKITVS